MARRGDIGAAAEGEQTPYYLLFAGSDAVPHGGLNDLVGTFTSEETARQAFRDIRLKDGSQASWAQLAVVDENQGVRAVSWFGIGAAPSHKPVRHPRSEGGVMEAATLELSSDAGPVELVEAPRRFRRIAVIVGLALVGVAAGVLSDDAASRPITPRAVTVDAGRPAEAPIVPFVTDPSIVVEGTSSADG